MVAGVMFFTCTAIYDEIRKSKVVGVELFVITGARDSTFISKIDDILKAVVKTVEDKLNHIHLDLRSDYVINFRTYIIDDNLDALEVSIHADDYEVFELVPPSYGALDDQNYSLPCVA